MKVGVYKDEWWPVFGLLANDDDWADAEVELDDEFVERWRCAEREFSEVQRIVRGAYERRTKESSGASAEKPPDAGVSSGE